MKVWVVTYSETDEPTVFRTKEDAWNFMCNVFVEDYNNQVPKKDYKEFMKEFKESYKNADECEFFGSYWRDRSINAYRCSVM